MTLLKTKNHKLNLSVGWYKGNPIVGLKVEVFSVIEDYPKGWISIILFGISIGKFELALLLNKN